MKFKDKNGKIHNNRLGSLKSNLFEARPKNSNNDVVDNPKIPDELINDAPTSSPLSEFNCQKIVINFRNNEIIFQDTNDEIINSMKINDASFKNIIFRFLESSINEYKSIDDFMKYIILESKKDLKEIDGILMSDIIQRSMEEIQDSNLFTYISNIIDRIYRENLYISYKHGPKLILRFMDIITKNI